MKKHTYLERASYSWSKDSIRMITIPSKTAKMTYFYAQELGHFKTKAPYFTERENLDSFLIIYTISGFGRLKYLGKEYQLKKGQCFFIHCQEYHYYWTKEDEEWEFLWIHFNGANVLGYYKQFVFNGFKVLNINEKNVEELMNHAIELNQRKNFTTELLTSNVIQNILTELLIRNCTNDMKRVFIPKYIKMIAKKIESSFREPLCLDDFQREWNRSKYHISKEFKKYIGVTVNEYIISSRISYAKELLKYSELSINEITFEIGMNNVTHFINLFKAREKKTPLLYRKEWKN